MGCYTQINSSSILKPKLFGDKYKFMKKRARYFLERDLVHFVGERYAQFRPKTALHERSL